MNYHKLFNSFIRSRWVKCAFSHMHTYPLVCGLLLVTLLSVLLPLNYTADYSQAYADTVPATQGTFHDLFSGSGQLELYQTMSYAHMMQSYNALERVYQTDMGLRMVPRPEGWYMFSRQRVTKPSWCSHVKSDTVVQSIVRVSTDRGLTWSAPTPIIPLAENTPYACGSTDGGVWFDKGVWYYVFQCYHTSWDGCVATRNSENPRGLFSVDKDVRVNTDAIADDLCGFEKTACDQIRVHGGGSFDIFAYENGIFYMSFDAVSYAGMTTTPASYRGTITTRDFKSFIPLGNDMDFSPRSHAGIQLNSAINGGVSFADTLFSEGYYYTLATHVERNSECFSNQHVAVTLHRSQDKGNLDAFSRSTPLFAGEYTSESGDLLPCQLGYTALIEDETGSYLMVQRLAQYDTGVDIDKSGLFMYRVVTNHSTQSSVSSSSSFSVSSSSSVVSQQSASSLSSSWVPSSAQNQTTLALRMYLTGAYNPIGGKMNTSLQEAGVIPSKQPYTAQPFGYEGNETLSSYVTPHSVVDWVLVSLSPFDQSTLTWTTAAILLADGSVVDATTLKPLVIPSHMTDIQSILRVQHRNHIAISIQKPIVLVHGSQTSLDLTTNNNVLLGNQKIVARGVYALFAGNVSGDSSIDSFDRNTLRAEREQVGVYSPFDVNLDGIIDAKDRNYLQKQGEVEAALVP